jgi:hypothetical protein
MTVTDKPKVIDLKTFKRAARTKADDQIRDKVWQALVNLWVNYAEEVNSRRVAGELCLSGEPSAVFSVLSSELVAMAQATKIENDHILEMLLSLALIECEPKGRLYQLLNKASNLLEYGDEDAWEKAMREMHAAGKLTDEQLADELKMPQ